MMNICKNGNIQINETNKIDTVDEEQYKLCLICIEAKGEIILCSKCKYVYCSICAEKINKLCSICFRNKNTINSNQNNYYFEYYDFEYYDFYSYYDDLVFEPSTSHYFSVMASFVASTIIGFCWIILFVVFGYIGIIFLLRIILYLIHFYNTF